MSTTQRYLRAFGIGFVSGMRSMAGPAATRFRQGGTSARIVPLLALGEMIVDKLPGVPARTSPPVLFVRAIAGGYAGMSLVGEEGDRRIGFGLGAAGAIAASYALLKLRNRAVAKSGLPDPVVALVEDAAAVGAGLLLTA